MSTVWIPNVDPLYQSTDRTPTNELEPTVHPLPRLTMYSVSQQEQYRKLRAQRRQKSRIKMTVLQTMCTAVLLIVAITYILPAFPGSHSLSSHNDFYHSLDDDVPSSPRSLLGSDPETTIPGYPNDLFSKVWW